MVKHTQIQSPSVWLRLSNVIYQRPVRGLDGDAIHEHMESLCCLTVTLKVSIRSAVVSMVGVTLNAKLEVDDKYVFTDGRVYPIIA